MKLVELLEFTLDNFRFAAAVAGWGMLLRDSRFKGDNSYERVLNLAKDALSDDKNGYQSEFVKLVEMSKGLVEALSNN